MNWKFQGLTVVSLSVAGAALLASAPRDAQAQPADAACQRYAQEAVRQNEQNRAYGAGFTPPVWSSDFGAHYRWCVQTGRTQTPTELATRARELQKHFISKRSLQDVCSRYGAEASRQFAMSQALQTGYGPPVWSGNPSHHANWCMAGNSSKTPDELASRAQQLQAFALTK